MMSVFKVFNKIENKFLIVFILSVAIALAGTTIVGYSRVETVYSNINDRITRAEFDKMETEISRLLSEMENVANVEIASTQSIKILSNYKNLSLLDMTYCIQEISRASRQVISNYPYIDSCYFFLDDEIMIAVSANNTRRLTVDVSERILEAVEAAKQHYRYYGGINQNDFPLKMPDPAYIMLCREVKSIYGSAVIAINIKESVLNAVYEDYMTDGLRNIRILDNEGMIISSGEKTEIGCSYESIEGISLSSEGRFIGKDSITTFERLDEYGMTIVSKIPSSVYTQELISIRNTMILTIALFLSLISAALYFWIKSRLRPIIDLQNGMRRAGQGDYTYKLVSIGNDELTDLTIGYNKMLSDLEQLNFRQKKTELELRESEMAALRNEINPHFLYNTLNTIKCLADIENNAEISKCTVALGRIVASLYKVKTSGWPLYEETRLIQEYLKIMNIRYGNGITFEEKIPDELLETIVPRFILQPIIENSILHGFEDRAFHGEIKLSANREGDTLYLAVEDNGCGMSQEALDKLMEEISRCKETSRVGILNVNRRIVLKCGPQYGITIENMSGGLKVSLKLPMDYHE